MKIDKNTRDRFKDQPYYGACEGNIYFIFIKLGKSKNSTDYVEYFVTENIAALWSLNPPNSKTYCTYVGLGASKAQGIEIGASFFQNKETRIKYA